MIDVIGEQAESGNTTVEVRRASPGTVTSANDDERTFTRKERAVLEAITDPATRNMTNAERAALAGVSDRQYYQIMARPWFRARHRNIIQGHVQSRVADLVEASAVTAATPGRDGFNDRKLLMEMTGHYIARQQIDHTSAGQPIVGVVGVSMDAL